MQEESKNLTPFTPSHLAKTLREGTVGEDEEQSFETYLKYLNLLHGLGQPRVQETNKKIWIALHHVLEETIGERGDLAVLDNPDLSRRCLRLMACLYPPACEDLAHRYRNGEKAFPKDPEAASKFSTPLNLPLSLVAR